MDEVGKEKSIVLSDRELEREQWNSRFTKYGFEGN